MVKITKYLCLVIFLAIRYTKHRNLRTRELKMNDLNIKVSAFPLNNNQNNNLIKLPPLSTIKPPAQPQQNSVGNTNNAMPQFLRNKPPVNNANGQNPQSFVQQLFKPSVVADVAREKGDSTTANIHQMFTAGR